MSEEMIFVFGSNLAGIHGAGAAKCALLQHGAMRGVGEGRTGRSYALPTKDFHINTRSLEDIQESVNTFLVYARQHPELTFNVTRVGCGLAGYSDEEIGPMFVVAPDNCKMPDEWLRFFCKCDEECGESCRGECGCGACHDLYIAYIDKAIAQQRECR